MSFPRSKGKLLTGFFLHTLCLIVLSVLSLLWKTVYFRSNANQYLIDTCSGKKTVPEKCRQAFRNDAFLMNKWKAVLDSFLLQANDGRFSTKQVESIFRKGLRATILVKILNRDNMTFDLNFDPKHFGRTSSVFYILRNVIKKYFHILHVPETGVSFLVRVDDCANVPVPTICSARHYKDWKYMIPAPLGNNRGILHDWATPFEGWDYRTADLLKSHRNYTWSKKEDRAIFSGALRMQQSKLGSCNFLNEGKCERAYSWREVNRGVLYESTKNRQDLFNVTFTGLVRNSVSPPEQFYNPPHVSRAVKFKDFQHFKYVINMGALHDWAERLRALLFLNSAVVLHEAETQEFFTPLLVPWKHYIPTNLLLTDIVTRVQWANENEKRVQDIIRHANKFGKKFLSERSMEIYWVMLIHEITKRQITADSTSER